MSAPAAALSTPAPDWVSGPFRVAAAFDQAVSGLAVEDFAVVNGQASDFSGAGAAYTVLVTPTAPGNCRVSLPAGAAVNAGGEASAAAAALVREYRSLAVGAPAVHGALAGAIVYIQGALWDPAGAGSLIVGTGGDRALWRIADPDGAPGAAAALGTLPAALTNPSGLTRMPDGTARLVDNFGSRLYTLDPAAPAAAAPLGVCAAPNMQALAEWAGRLYIAATTTRTLWRIPAGGAPGDALSLGSYDPDGAVGGNIVGMERIGSSLLAVTTEGRLYRIDDPDAPRPAALGQAAGGPNIRGLAWDRGAWLYGLDDTNDRLVRWPVTVTAADLVAPRATLSGPVGPVLGAFTLAIDFSEPVTGLALADLAVSGGSASDLAGAGAAYTAAVTPAGDGALSVALPAGAAEDAAGNPSTAALPYRVTAALAPAAPAAEAAVAPAAAAARWRRAARALAPSRVLIAALEISHPDAARPIRVVCDTRPWRIEGADYAALRFGWRLASDADGAPPRAEIWVDNVGAALTQWIEAAKGGRGASVRLLQVSAAAADPGAGGIVEWEQRIAVQGMHVDRRRVVARLGVPVMRGRAAVLARHDPARSPGLF